jgi:hypothetical protein
MRKADEAKGKRIRIDFRSIPSLLFIILGFIPWFNSTVLYESFWQDEIIPIESFYIGPFPFVGIWTEGSAFMLKIPEQALLWALVTIPIFWAPLLWFIIACGSPSHRRVDELMGVSLFLPASFSFLAHWIVANVASSPVYFSVPPWVFFCIPIGWLIFVGFLRIRGFYRYGDFSDELEYDIKIQQETKK